MSVFRVRIAVSDTERRQWRELSADINTSLPESYLPGSVLRELGISPAMTGGVRLPDGIKRYVSLGYAWLKLNNREAMTHFVFADESTRPLLGRVAINCLLLEFNSVNRQLVPMSKFPL